MKYIEDQIGVIVTTVTAIMAASDIGITYINYLFGPIQEIDDSLIQMTKGVSYSEVKYPLVALFTDIEEGRGKDSSVESELSLHLIVGCLTRPEYTASQRLTLNFKAKIIPVYEQLLKSIASSGYYKQAAWQDIEHIATRCYKYGKGKYAFSDYIDCIELTNLKLTLHKT
jgi:hypothetical protein